MAMSEMSVICTSCLSRMRARPKRNMLGLLKFHCFSCRSDFLYPLTSAYRTTYWVLIITMTIAIATLFAQGRFGFPGLMTTIAIVGLVKDQNIRKQVAAAASDAADLPASGRSVSASADLPASRRSASAS
ncbi:MAG: hypothetical protein ACJ8AJ_04630 [Gemmatimonadaceae bacterium]